MNRLHNNAKSSLSLLKLYNKPKQLFCFRQIHAGVMEPFRLSPVKNRSDTLLKLLAAIRRKSPPAVWKTYKELSDNNKLEELSVEHFTLILRTFQLKNLKPYTAEDIKSYHKCLNHILEMMKLYGHKPCIRDYNLFLDFYGRSENWNSVQNIWKEIKGPNVYSYNLYMQAALKCKKYVDAAKIYNQMKALKITPNEFTCNTLIELYGMNWSLKEADQLFESFFGKEKNKTLFKLFMNKFDKKNYYASTTSPLARVLTHKDLKKTPLKSSTETFNALIKVHGKKKNIYGLKHIYSNLMPLYNVEPDLKTYNILVKNYCYNGDIDSARKIITEMESSGITPNVVTFNHLFRHEALKKNRPKTAENLIKYMKSQYDIDPLPSMYKSLIKIHNKRNREEEAKRLFKEYSVIKNKPRQLKYFDSVTK